LFHEQIAFILDILSILGSQITRSPTFYCVCVWMTVFVRHNRRPLLTEEKPRFSSDSLTNWIYFKSKENRIVVHICKSYFLMQFYKPHVTKVTKSLNVKVPNNLKSAFFACRLRSNVTFSCNEY